MTTNETEEQISKTDQIKTIYDHVFSLTEYPKNTDNEELYELYQTLAKHCFVLDQKLVNDVLKIQNKTHDDIKSFYQSIDHFVNDGIAKRKGCSFNGTIKDSTTVFAQSNAEKQKEKDEFQNRQQSVLHSKPVNTRM